MLYDLLQFVHVLSAIIAVGFNASYGIWLATAAKSPEHTGFTLRAIKTLDDRFANPAYALLLITGLGMVFESGIPLFDTFWLSTGLGLYIVTTLIALLAFTPTLRKQVDLAEAGRMSDPQFAVLAKRGSILGAVLGILVVVIVYLMVAKPTLG
jgi:uncharacterized membrane protein